MLVKVKLGLICKNGNNNIIINVCHKDFNKVCCYKLVLICEMVIILLLFMFMLIYRLKLGLIFFYKK
jgi:hypothetical protein